MGCVCPTERFHCQDVWLDYEYRSLTNFLPAQLTTRHLQSLDEMERALGYALKWQNLETVTSASQFNWPIFFAALIFAGVISVGAGILYIYQRRLPAVPPPLAHKELSGLGGWLVLIAIRLIISPIFQAAHILRSLRSFGLWRWEALTSPGGTAYHPAWAPLLILELFGEMSILILTILVLVLFLQRRRVVPVLFIALLLASLVFVVGDMIGLQIIKTIPETTKTLLLRNLLAAIIGCAIWIPYMLLSRRVKATFTQ